MKLVSVPESVLVDLIWNTELYSVGVCEDYVDELTATLREYMPEEAFYPHRFTEQEEKATVVELFTCKTHR